MRSTGSGHIAFLLGLCVLGGYAWGCVAPVSRPKPIDITGLTAAPVPALAGQPVTLSAVVKSSEEKAELYASMDFGDGSALMYFYGSSNWEDMKAIQHTYAAAGVYSLSFYASTPMMSAQAFYYIVVGRGNVVNPINGIAMTATDASGLPRYAGGTTNVKINANKVFASSVSTEFQDLPGRSATVVGTQVSHTYTQRGIYKATSTALDSSGASLGKCRKMLNVSSRDAGDSAALADPPSTNIVMKKMQGKVLFGSTKADKLSFSGEVKLPAGLNPAAPGGTEVSVGISNLVDTVIVDAKGKATLPSANGIITKLGVKFPKLAGAAAGGEVAKVDVSLTLTGMSAAGLDTEGITSALRSDEATLKAADRGIQVDILLAGVPYETLAPVQYKCAKPAKGATTSASGQFKGMPSRSPAQ